MKKIVKVSLLIWLMSLVVFLVAALGMGIVYGIYTPTCAWIGVWGFIEVLALPLLFGVLSVIAWWKDIFNFVFNDY